MAGSKRSVKEKVITAKTNGESRGGWEAVLGQMTSDLIFIIDREDSYVYTNPAFKTLLGLEPKALLGKKWGDFIDPEDLERIKKARLGQVYEFRQINSKGNPVWFEGRFSTKEVNRSTFLIGVARPFGKRKKENEKLKKTVDKYRHLLQSAPVMIFQQDEKLKYTYINRQLKPFNQIKLLGLTDEVLPVKKDELKALVEAKKSVLEGLREVAHTTRMSVDGEIYYFEFLIEPNLSQSGKVTGISGTMTDVTGRQVKHLALIGTQKRYGMAISNGQAFYIEYDVLTRKGFVPDQWAESMGYNAGDLPTPAERFAWWKARIHPDDRTYVLKHYNDFISGRVDSYRVEYRWRHQDGSFVWVRSVSQAYRRDEKGKAKLVTGLRFDITQEKHREHLLKLSAEASRAITPSLDHIHVLKRVTRTMVPLAADWASIHLIEEDGNLANVAYSGDQGETMLWAVKQVSNKAIDLGIPALETIISSGKTALVEEIDDSMLTKAAKDQYQLSTLRKMQLLQILYAPLKVKKKTVGVMTLVISESRRRFEPEDRDIVEQIANKVSLAIENSVLYQEVKWERERLVELLANVPSIVWETWADSEGNEQVNFVSPYIKEMTGYTTEDWLSKPNFWLTITHPKDRKKAADELAEIYRQGQGGISRHRWLTKDNRTIWVESRSFVVKNSAGIPVGMRGVTLDVTEQMEEERRKDEFISIASHELKTPITSVKVFNHILKKIIAEDSDERVQTYLKRMDTQLNKLTMIINDLLDVTKIQSGRVSFNWEDSDLKKMVQEAVENHQTIHSHYRFGIDGDINGLVKIDRERINQVLVNLLSNAVKYSPRSTEVIVLLSQNDNEVVVGVKDFGIGIPQEHQNKIFSRFYRVQGSDDKTFPGLGIGLYICKQIIDRHQGKIWLESEAGSGSTFYFSLPVKPK